ncbi:hypothetical protein NDU88_001266 [Pleurodeles waltl]|uniref:Uncharacterized protein n=1 Tax=Pleurodeles waltl TaxID=8319 RepID=A0AAV7T016_PLEWA|nr:hypothetical protein NDU88_001266 [Pleurodeles waltl]
MTVPPCPRHIISALVPEAFFPCFTTSAAATSKMFRITHGPKAPATTYKGPRPARRGQQNGGRGTPARFTCRLVLRAAAQRSRSRHWGENDPQYRSRHKRLLGERGKAPGRYRQENRRMLGLLGERGKAPGRYRQENRRMLGPPCASLYKLSLGLNALVYSYETMEQCGARIGPLVYKKQNIEKNTVTQPKLLVNEILCV